MCCTFPSVLFLCEVILTYFYNHFVPWLISERMWKSIFWKNPDWFIRSTMRGTSCHMMHLWLVCCSDLKHIHLIHIIPHRNYHVFYYLLAGASEEERKSFHLLQPEEYHYLNQVQPIHDCEIWHHSRCVCLCSLRQEEKRPLSSFSAEHAP